MEDLDRQLFAMDDPRGFLSTYPDRTIIDEVQKVPELFSYLQTHVDEQNLEGMYLLAGSHNFLLMQKHQPIFGWQDSHSKTATLLIQGVKRCGPTSGYGR